MLNIVYKLTYLEQNRATKTKKLTNQIMSEQAFDVAYNPKAGLTAANKEIIK